MGKSTNDNLTALTVARKGILDIGCSGYAHMAMLNAAFQLAHSGLMTLPQAIACFSLNPVRAVGLADETGSLTQGKMANIVLVDVEAPVPRVLKTFVAGRQFYALQ